MEALIVAGFCLTGVFSLKRLIEFINLHTERQDAE